MHKISWIILWIQGQLAKNKIMLFVVEAKLSPSWDSSYKPLPFLESLMLSQLLKVDPYMGDIQRKNDSAFIVVKFRVGFSFTYYQLYCESNLAKYSRPNVTPLKTENVSFNLRSLQKVSELNDTFLPRFPLYLSHQTRTLDLRLAECCTVTFQQSVVLLLFCSRLSTSQHFK